MLYELISNNIDSNYIRYCEFDSEDAQRVIHALEATWINGSNSLSIPYWAEQVGNQFITKLVYALSKAGWINSMVRTRYSSFSLNETKLSDYMPTDKQLEFRKQSRIRKYRMRHTDELQPSNLVSTPHGIQETGLDRPGFAKCANQSFQFDTTYLLKYYDAILANTIKSMTKMATRYPDIMIDKANYSDISNELLDWHLCNPQKSFNMERNISDQRGRSIYGGLRRVFNPVANKDARSLMIARPVFISQQNHSALDDIYLFIAELTGSKSKSWASKRLSGLMAYNKRTLHKLDLHSSANRKDLHENIWLERMYDKLDTLADNGQVLWDIPIEMDATASILQFVGILTNDKRLLDKTNVIYPTRLKDAWTIDGLPRLMTKSFMTPSLYGSSASASKLIKDAGLEATREQLKIVRNEYKSGGFAVAVAMKDFWIKHSSIESPSFTVDMGDEQFTVHVNKFKAVGSELKAYTGYDSKSDHTNTFLIHNVIRVPDYDRFSLFFPTLLIHNRDSKAMDNSMDKIITAGEWAIAIHDAGLVMPGTQLRKHYVAELESLRINRNHVLSSFRKSIGATTLPADIAWAKLHNSVNQLSKSTKLSESALK